jgi:hypothetical protein
MTKVVVVCSPEDTIIEVMSVMTQQRIRHLPVKTGDRLVGIISIGDVLKNRLRELQLEAEVLRDYARARPGHSVMGLKALRKHRHLSAAAALLGVLLYTALVTLHVVSQTTYGVGPDALSAAAHAVISDEPCHDSLPAAGKANDHSRPLPGSPPTKCPFCTGYAVLLISVAGGSVDLLTARVAARSFESPDRPQLVCSASLPSWRPRAPPTIPA